MSELTTIMQDYGSQIVKDVGQTIRDDIEANVWNEMMFADADLFSGESGQKLIAVIPLAQARIDVKVARGGIAPWVPRIMTGTMLRRLGFSHEGITGQVYADGPAAIHQQEGEPLHEWVNEEGDEMVTPTTKRPWFGISEAAMTSSKEIINNLGEKMVRAMDGVTVTRTLTITR